MRIRGASAYSRSLTESAAAAANKVKSIFVGKARKGFSDSLRTPGSHEDPGEFLPYLFFPWNRKMAPRLLISSR